MHRILKNLHAEIIEVTRENYLLALRDDIRLSNITIDAIFGIGLNRNVEGLYFEIIKIMNEEAKQIIAVDIPSGINGDTGKANGIAVKASKTITFHKMKKGLVNCKEYTGEIIIEDIGIPDKVW